MRLFLFFSLVLFLINLPAFAQHEPKKNREDAYERAEHKNEKNEYAHAHSSWYREMLKKRPNLNKAALAFSQYFRMHGGENSRLKDRFESWIRQASLYKDKDGFAIAYPQSGRPRNAITGVAGITTAAGGSFGSWTMIGPANMTRTECGNSNKVTGGFCDRVYVNPYNTQNLFAGFSYGGLWVSTDQGGTWQMTDGSFANGTNTYANRDYYYGEIEAHSLNSSLVFAATEAGLLKSTNAGVNWTLSPTLNRNSSPNSRPYYISLATNDQNVILSTFGKQVYRSADGGTTWSMVFDNSSGGTSHTYTSQYNFNTPFGLNDRTFNFFGLEADFSNPNHFYLGVWNSSNQACIYQSTDKGVTFSLLVNLNTLLGTSWGVSNTLCLKTIPSSPNKFFVYEQFATNKPYYKLSSTGALLSSNTINTYPEAFDIDWKNENTLYEGQYSPDYILRSTDGGTTFATPYPTASPACNYLHADIRGISAVGQVVLIGNDGGLGLSVDSAASLKGTGFEINSMDIWGFSSSRKSDICLTGLDHNQTFVRSFAGTGGWVNIKGADAGVCTVNPYNDHWLYYDWAYGVNKGYLNADGSVTESSVSTLPDLGSLQFHSNIAFDIYGIEKANNNIVVHSTDNMASATTFKDFGVTVNAIRIARRDPRTMYVLLNNATIQKTTDSGTTWVAVTPSSAASGGQTNITAIEAGKTPGELWAAYGNAQNTAKVLYSTDGGSNWSNITTSNLPAAAVSDIAYQRGTNGGVYIIIITASGTTVWYRNNTMLQWQQLGNTLPLMGYVKSRLFVVPAINKIRFGSSRGAWETDLYEPSPSVEAGIAADRKTSRCSGDSLQFYDASAYPPGTVSYAWQFPGGSPATSTLENPNVSYATPGTYSVTLTVTNPSGSDAQTLTNFITVSASECGIDTIAGKSLDLSLSTTDIATCSLPLNTNTMTITAWVNPNGLQPSFTGIFTHGSRTGIIMNNGSGTNQLGYMWGDNQWGWNSGLVLPSNQWSHIAMVITPSNTTLYLNGTAVTNSVANPVIDLSQTLWDMGDDIGNGSTRNFSGQIDEVCFYKRSLSQNEIREKMHLTRTASDTGIVAYYQFNESVSDYFYNKIGSGSKATNGGAAQAISTAPVAGGVSTRIAVSAAGTYDFGSADAVLNFKKPSGSAKYPNGDVIVYKLNAQPSGLPTAGLNYSKRYWIIRSFGTNATLNTVNTMTFRNTGFSATGNSLFKRNANDFGTTTWSSSIASSTTGSSSANGGTQAFSGLSSIVTTFGQFTIGSTSMPTNIVLEETGLSNVFDNEGPFIKLFPNPVPAGQNVKISTNISGAISIALYNAEGRMVKKEILSESREISTTGLQSGVYFYQMEGAGPAEGHPYKIQGKLVIL